MSDVLPMMPWYPRDFIAATRAMRLAERGAYRDLLDFQWDMGKLPADLDRLARLLGVSRAEFDDVWPAIRDKFVERDGCLFNERVDRDRETAIAQRDRKRRGAETTNARRDAKRGGERPQSDPDSGSGSGTVSGRSPSPSPTPLEEKNSVDPESQAPNGSSASAPSAARAAPEIPQEMQADWRPNSINMDWMSDSGLSIAQIATVIEEFVHWARHTKLRKIDRNWQLTFYRNPLVKRAVGTARSKRGKGNGAHQEHHETPYERAGRRLREWAERAGVDPTILG